MDQNIEDHGELVNINILVKKSTESTRPGLGSERPSSSSSSCSESISHPSHDWPHWLVRDHWHDPIIGHCGSL
jgi:hypothetical protein